MRKECRAKVNAEASPETMHAAFQRLFPMPCRSRHVALCLLPQQPLAARLVSPLAASPATVVWPVSLIVSPRIPGFLGQAPSGGATDSVGIPMGHFL